MPFGSTVGRVQYPIVQPTTPPNAPLYEEASPSSSASSGPSFVEALAKASQKCLLAGAACAGMPGTRQRGGFFDGVVSDVLERDEGQRNRFIVETMPTLKQLEKAERAAKESGVPMADTLHRQERQEHMKSTIDSFNGRKQRGVLKFLLLDAENAAAACDGPIVHKALVDDSDGKVKRALPGMAGKKKVKTVPAGPEQDLAVVTGGFEKPPHASSAVDWWESNVALIGSEEDRALRKRAAQTEPAWFGCGQAPGVEVWRIEQFKVVPWPREKFGTLHEGDSYVCLHTERAVDVEGYETDKLLYNIHFWLGRTTPIDAAGTAAYKTVELDDLLDGQATHHREVMGNESDAFKALFDGQITYAAGGVPSGFRKVCDVDLETFVNRLLRVTKVGNNSVIVEVPCTRESLHQEAAFVLDCGKKLYLWNGTNSSVFERGLARLAMEELETARAGQAMIANMVDGDFWYALGGNGHIAQRAVDAVQPEPQASMPLGHGVLFRLSDTTGRLMFDEVHRGALNLSMLIDDDVYVCDKETELIVWMGKGSSDRERRAAMLTATKYLALQGKPHTTPIKVFKSTEDAMKDESFAQIFAGA